MDREFGDMPVNSVFAYYQGLHILANGLSIVGNGIVESKAKPGGKCVAALLHVNLTCADKPSNALLIRMPLSSGRGHEMRLPG